MLFRSIWFLCMISTGLAFKISLTSNAPAVVGATITFRAEVTDDNGQRPRETFLYKWRDGAAPIHTYKVQGDMNVVYWNVTYLRDINAPGIYTVQVEISRWMFIYWNPIGSKRIEFELTNLLNGDMNNTQSNQTVTSDYVSTASEVTHSIHLWNTDQAFLTKNATSVITFWFVDCIYYGATSDLTFKFNYSNAADQERLVEALVVASFDPLPPPTTIAPPTTTTTPVLTTLAPSPNSTTTPKPSTTTIKPTIPTTMTPMLTTTPSNNITALVQPNITVGTNVSVTPIVPYVCLASSVIPPDPNKTYGYFSESIKVKAPVSNVVVSPTNWIKHGEILNLSVACNGSSPFLYCFLIIEGDYNVTGNESCSNMNLITDCQMNLHRYIHNPGGYTILIVIKNEVSKKVTPHGLNIYEVKKLPQLSVVVVPVTCSAIAVILVVFGAAYYMQSRHRYTIEVADFDFGQASDLEYMTFSQRLRAAINTAFARNHDSNIDSKAEDNKSTKSQDSSTTNSTDISQTAPTPIAHM